MTTTNDNFRVKNGLEVTTSATIGTSLHFSDGSVQTTAYISGNVIPLISAAETTATTTATGKLVSISDNGGRLAYYNNTVSDWLYVFNDSVVYTPPAPPPEDYDPFYADVKFLLEATPNVDTKGNVSISNNGATQSSTQTKFGNTYSWYMDGASSTNLTVSNAINQMATNDFTMDFWMWNSSSNTTDNAVFAWDNEFEYRHETSGNWFWLDFGQGIYPAAAGTNPTENGWTFFTMERHGSNFNIYLDGVRIYQGTASGINVNNSTIWFGNEFNNKAWTGYFDYIRLTQAARHEGADFTPPASAAEYEPAA